MTFSELPIGATFEKPGKPEHRYVKQSDRKAVCIGLGSEVMPPFQKVVSVVERKESE